MVTRRLKVTVVTRVYTYGRHVAAGGWSIQGLRRAGMVAMVTSNSLRTVVSIWGNPSSISRVETSHSMRALYMFRLCIIWLR